MEFGPRVERERDGISRQLLPPLPHPIPEARLLLTHILGM